MTVIRPNSISGVTSITALANEINVFKHDGVLAGLQLNGVNHHTSSGVSTFHTLNVLGNVSVGGTLTYQDVTNVDSLGIGTFRTGINVSGGQLDVGSNIKLGNAGVITATSFVGSGANLTGITAGLSNIVEDTSPQLGGNLDNNGKNITFGDSAGSSDDRLTFGAGTDLSIYHDNSNSRTRIEHSTDNALQILQGGNAGMLIQNQNSYNIEIKTNAEDAIKCVANGAVELYHNNELQALTAANGFRVKTAGDTDTELSIVGPEGRNGIINLEADDGDDNADIWGLVAATDGTFLLRNYASGSYETNLKATGNGNVELYHDNSKVFETTSVGVNITGQSTFVRNAGDANFIVGSTNASGAYLVLDGDSNGDAAGGDYAYLLHNSAGNLQISTNNPNSDSTIEFRTNGTHRCSVSATGMFEPALNNTYDLGTSSLRWRNIYTNDLNLSNEGSANSVDGTWGDYTIQEGESDLFLINKRSGKKYKFMLQEVS